MIEMFNRELTPDQLIGFVESHTENGLIQMPKEWALELIEAYEELQKNNKNMQCLDDMNDILEPIKIKAALESEILKLEYRITNEKSTSILDYTIIAALQSTFNQIMKEKGEANGKNSRSNT